MRVLSVHYSGNSMLADLTEAEMEHDLIEVVSVDAEDVEALSGIDAVLLLGIDKGEDPSGIEFLRRLRALYPAHPILVYSHNGLSHIPKLVQETAQARFLLWKHYDKLCPTLREMVAQQKTAG